MIENELRTVETALEAKLKNCRKCKHRMVSQDEGSFCGHGKSPFINGNDWLGKSGFEDYTCADWEGR